MRRNARAVGSLAAGAAPNAATEPLPSMRWRLFGSAPAVQERARKWLATPGPNFPGDPTTGILGESEEDQARFEDFANDAPCPALNPATGLCDVYAWRPM